MRRINLAIITIALFTLVNSCQKNGDKPSDNATAILTSGKWHNDSAISVITYSGLGTITVNIILALPTCQADNYAIFNSDGSTIIDEGDTKCNSTDPQTKDGGSWKLLKNNTQFQFTDAVSGYVVTGDIISFDDKLLKFTYATSGPGATALTTYYFSHIK